MKPSVIVWDLETVPDLGGFAAANDLAGKSDVEVREAIGDKFPKHIYHSIVCIGALIAHWEPDHWAVDAVGAPHVGERTEKQLIAAFCDKIAELRFSIHAIKTEIYDLRNGRRWSICTAEILSYSCLRWVKLGPGAMSAQCPDYPRKRRCSGHQWTSQKCQ